MPCSRASPATVDETSAQPMTTPASARTTWRPRNASCAAACRRWKSSTSASRACCASACSTSCAAAPKSRSARCGCPKYSEFIRNLVVPTNLNLVHMKPLRGTALMVFDPNLVFLMVDNLFGGDGRFHTRVEGRDFTQTEQRIIQRMLEHRVRGLRQVVGAGVSARVRIRPLGDEHAVRQHRHAERSRGRRPPSRSSSARSAARCTSACRTR